MPTYEYECPQGHSFEVFQRMTDKPVSKCPECGKKASRKISGGAGFLFKGEGFYITDYRSEDYKKKASAETGDGASAKGEAKQGKSKEGKAKEGAADAGASKASKPAADD